MVAKKLILFVIGVACAVIFIFTLMPAMQRSNNKDLLRHIGQVGLVLSLGILLIARYRRKS